MQLIDKFIDLLIEFAVLGLKPNARVTKSSGKKQK